MTALDEYDFVDLPIKTRGVNARKGTIAIGVDIGREHVTDLNDADEKLDQVRMDIEIKHNPDQGDDEDQMTMGDEIISFTSMADTGQLSVSRKKIGLTLSFHRDSLSPEEKATLLELCNKSCTMTSKVIGDAEDKE